MKKMISVIVCMLALVMCLTACGQSADTPDNGASLANGGVLILSVNPEIAVEYDENGTVTGVTARNDDALAIISSCEGMIGQPTRNVVADLVTAIGEAGYFVEEIEGKGRQITLEIEPGSSLPSATFLDDVIADIRSCVSSNHWTTPLVVEGESSYGMSNYVDTDYGVGNDGFTDYADTDYGPDNDGVTDYDHNINDDTDYGEGNDGVTDYDGPDYADNTDYGINADGNTDYGNTNYGNTNYSDADYGDSAYDAPAQQTPAAAIPPANYGSSDSGYSNFDANADSGYSNYEGES